MWMELASRRDVEGVSKCGFGQSGRCLVLESALASEREKVKRLSKMLDDEIETVDKDERHHYKPALIQINAPLALIQVDLAARIGLAKRLKAALAETEEK